MGRSCAANARVRLVAWRAPQLEAACLVQSIGRMPATPARTEPHVD